MDDFRAVPNGGAGVEHRPALVATTFEDQLGPTELCRLMSENPARVFGMWPRKGCLAEGSDADVCVWDPSVEWTISGEDPAPERRSHPVRGLRMPRQGAYSPT